MDDTLIDTRVANDTLWIVALNAAPIWTPHSADEMEAAMATLQEHGILGVLGDAEHPWTVHLALNAVRQALLEHDPRTVEMGVEADWLQEQIDWIELHLPSCL